MVIARSLTRLPQALAGVADRAGRLIALTLILIWLAVLFGLPAHLPTQAASWLTFVGLLITPGYLLGDIVAWRIDLDNLERLALAFPLGVTVLALPGLAAMLRHLTAGQLVIGWTLTTSLVLIAWLVHSLRIRRDVSLGFSPWARDEIILLLLLAAVFVYIFPTLCIYKIDGDAYTFIAFVRDAMTGRPMNVTEAFFGTDIGTGVRMAFNQMFPVSVLWSHFSHIDRITLSAEASRTMIALLAMLSSYMLGKAARDGDRRFGLFTVAIQMLIYMVAPFFRGDSASSFFFERINTDKFTVPITMLPVDFALCFRFLRTGRRDAWLTAALVTFAVSAIHPLIAAMLALALTAFGGFHLLLNLRRRDAWLRVFGLAVLVGLVMFLPFIQLFMARGEEPLAPTYPKSFEGWSIGDRMLPLLPFTLVKSVGLYGPLPALDTVTAEQANTDASPLLIWRFFGNMQQRRLILFNLKRYISDPSLVLEPPYLLALLMLPLLLKGIRSREGDQFALSTTLAVIFVMYNPVVTPILGALVVPWLLWRFVWLLPYALTITLGIQRLLNFLIQLVTRLPVRRLSRARNVLLTQAPLALVLVAGVLCRPTIAAYIQELNEKSKAARFYPAPQKIIARLEQETQRTGPATLVAEQALSVTIPAYVADAVIIAHRALNTSEIFPANRQDEALQRLIDQNRFYELAFLTTESLDILQRYDARYVITSGGSDLDLQLHLTPQWFEWLLDDQSYSLFAVRKLPTVTASILGNTAMVERDWATAQRHYQTALQENPADLLALVGLAESYRAQGRFDDALTALQQAMTQIDLPVLHYRLGLLYAELGQVESSIAEFDQAQRTAPLVARFHLALGDACLSAGRLDCATEQYQAAVDTEEQPDEASRLMGLADLWQQRGDAEQALALYEQAVALNPSERNKLALVGVYQGQEQYDKAEALLRAMIEQSSLSAKYTSAMAALLTKQDRTDEALAFYRRTLRLQSLQMEDTLFTHLSMAETLLKAKRYDEARREIDQVLVLQPQNASAYMLLGNLYTEQNQPQEAIQAYRTAIQLDPTAVTAYTSLSEQYRQQAASPEENMELLVTATQFNPDQASLFLSLGDQWRRQGDNATAISAYQLALDLLEPYDQSTNKSQKSVGHSRAMAYSRLAQVYEDMGWLDTAMTYYNASVTAAPTESWTRVALADALRRRNQVADAEALFRQVIAQYPTDVEAYLHLADLLSARGDTTAASQLYDTALQATASQTDDKQRTKVLLGLGNFYSQARQPQIYIGSAEDFNLEEEPPTDPATQSALDAYTQALQADENLSAVAAMARLYQEIGQPEQAIQLYQQEIQRGLEEHWTPAVLSRYYNGLADVYTTQSQFEQATQTYRQAIALDGWSPGPRLGLGQVLSQMDDHAGALEQFETAVQVAPGAVSAQLALAQALDQQGEKDHALALYQAAAATHPGDSSAHLALARAWQERNQPEEAEQSYHQAMAVTPGQAEAYIGLAGLYTLQARYTEAEALLRQAIQLDYDNTQAYMRLGALMARLARYPEALAAYEQALQADPSDWHVYAGLAQVQGALGQAEQAIDNLKKASAIDRTTTDPLLQLANLYQEQNRLDLAEEVLLVALERAPDNVNARYALAKLYQSLALNDEALIQMRLAAEENPDSMEALVSYANELHRQGRDSEAETYYRQAEQASEPSAAGYRALALARQAQGHSDEALHWIEQAIAYAPDEPMNWMIKSQLQTQAGDPDAALASLHQATQLGPAEGQTWQALGKTLLTTGQTQEAIAALEQAISVELTYLPTYGALVQAYQGLGQYDRAAQIIAAGRLAVPGSYLNDVYEARLLESQQKWDEARTALTQAIAKAPGVSEPYLSLGELLLRRGHYDDALDIYGQAAQARPGDWHVYAGLGQTYQALGQIEQAALNLQNAVELDRTAYSPLIQLASLYQEQNRPDQAEETLLRALDRSPGNSSARYALAALYQSLALNDEALVQLRQVVQENPGSMEALVSYANLLRLLGRDREAQELYSQAEQASQPSAAGYRALAQARQTQGRQDEALALLERAIAFAPDDPVNWIQKGQLEARTGELDTALASLRRATELSPGQGQTWHSLGNILLSAGQTQEAAAAFQQAITVEPTYIPAHGSLIQAYQELNLDDQVAQVVALAQAAVPGSYWGDLYAARALQEEQQWDQARAALEQAMAKAPGVPDVLIAMGQLEQLQGHSDQAVSWYQEAAAMRPGDRTANTNLIDLLLRLGRNQEALAQSQLALSNRPGDTDLLLQWGQVQRRLGRYDQARDAFAKAARLDQADSKPFSELAALFTTQSKLELAIRAYRQAIAREPSRESYYLGLSQALAAFGQSDQAVNVLREGLSRVSQPARLYAALSTHYLQHGEPGLALETLEQAQAQILTSTEDSASESSQVALAWAAYYRAQADFERAEHFYTQTLTLQPQEASLHLALADFYRSRGRLAEASSHYEQAVDLEPSNPDVYLALGGAYQLDGHTLSATVAYSQALALAPTLEDAYTSLAELYQSQTRWDAAQAVYEQGLKVVPTSGRLLSQYSAFQLQRGDDEQALTLLDWAVQLAPGPETWIARANLYQKLGRVADAESDLQAASAAQPGSSQALIAWGDFSQAHGDVAAAAQAYAEAVSLASGTAEGYLRLANLAYQQGNLSETWRQLEAAQEAEPASADPLVQLAQVRAAQGDLAGAESAYRQALDIAPLSMEAYLGLAGVAQRRSGSLSAGLQWLEQARRLGLAEGPLDQTIGELYRQAAQSGQTARYLQQAIAADPASPDGYLALAALYLDQGLPFEAERHIRQALDISPRNDNAHIALGNIYLRLGDEAAAERSYRLAISLDATQTDGYVALAGLHSTQGAYSEAIADYQQAIARAPLDWSLWVSLGNVYAQMTDYAAAVTAYERASAMNPVVVEPWLRLGDIYLLQGDVAAALAAFEKAQVLRPDDAAPLLRLSNLFEIQGDSEQAEAFAWQAIAVAPLEGSGYATLARLEADQSLTDEAIAHYATALRLDPRGFGAYTPWVRLHIDIFRRYAEKSRLEEALDQLENGPDAQALWAHVALALGYAELEGLTDRVLDHWQAANRIDPVYAELYQQLALVYEAYLDGRSALEAWYRFLYAAGPGTEGDVAQAHIDWLLQGRIEQPADGAAVAGAVQIVGSAARPDFQFYKLEYSPAASPEQWFTIGDLVYAPVEHGPLVTWQTAGLVSGAYRLRLTVVDSTGNYGPYDEITVWIR